MRRSKLQLTKAKEGVANSLIVPLQERVPEAQFLDAHRNEKPGSLGDVSLLVGMPVPAAVEFDGEAGFATIEVQKLFPNGMSATEFVGAESPVTQPAPYELFRPGGFLAQCAGAFGVGHGENVARCVSRLHFISAWQVVLKRTRVYQRRLATRG